MGDGVTAESRASKVARDPAEPSDEERRRHECTHAPFRSWCAHCVRGRMPNLPRVRAVGGRHEVPE
eukprot:12265057-Alexandrium_andersonii.AAC.1